MNIKELVLVISILLSIRIAEYAMKKYKEQKDVEVTKKQKSRKQTKKYIITAPSILKVGLPCGIFFGCTTIAFILSQIFKLFREQSASGQRKKQTTLLLYLPIPLDCTPFSPIEPNRVRFTKTLWNFNVFSHP